MRTTWEHKVVFYRPAHRHSLASNIVHPWRSFRWPCASNQALRICCPIRDANAHKDGRLADCPWVHGYLVALLLFHFASPRETSGYHTSIGHCKQFFWTMMKDRRANKWKAESELGWHRAVRLGVFDRRGKLVESSQLPPYDEFQPYLDNQ